MVGRAEIVGDSVEVPTLPQHWSEEGLKALFYSAAHVGLDMQRPVRRHRLLSKTVGAG